MEASLWILLLSVVVVILTGVFTVSVRDARTLAIAALKHSEEMGKLKTDKEFCKMKHEGMDKQFAGISDRLDTIDRKLDRLIEGKLQ